MPATGQNRIEKTLKALKENRFDAHFVETRADASELILGMIPISARVCAGDSATLRQTPLFDALVARGNDVINPFNKEMVEAIAQDPDTHREFVRLNHEAYDSDVYLTGCNAVTEDGKIVSIDGTGNRVSAMIYGAPRVILTAGRNKIVRDRDAAIDRIKNVIAPEHARRKGRKTPCVVTGKCSDCKSPQRICNITVILEKRPLYTAISVVIINEDLGLGWDPSWDDRYIEQIRAGYYQHTWAHELPEKRGTQDRAR